MYAFLLGGGATNGFLTNVGAAGLKGATGAAPALLNAAMRSLNELGLLLTGGGSFLKGSALTGSDLAGSEGAGLGAGGGDLIVSRMAGASA